MSQNEQSDNCTGVGSSLHLVTQDGQPYGSVRRCCERCGVMAGPHAFTQAARDLWWTDDQTEYSASEWRCTTP